MTTSAIPRQTATWDERRNSSRVFPVPPDALPAALQALARMRVEQPALTRWIEDGSPRITDAEHFQRFSEPYRATRATKRSKSA